MKSNKQNSTNTDFSVNWFPGHMKKTSDLIKKLSHTVHIVIEILDARIPFSSRNSLIFANTAHLPRIIVLSKSDLAYPNITDAWVTHFKKKGYGTIATNLTSTKNQKNLIKKITTLIKTILSKDTPPLKNNKKNNFTSILHTTNIALVCGIPNVGKSTLINSLSQAKKVKVGNRPGVTIHKQFIKVDSKDKYFSWGLVDTPGLLKHKLNEQESLHLSACKVVKETIYDPVELALAFLNRLTLAPDRNKGMHLPLETLIAHYGIDHLDKNNLTKNESFKVDKDNSDFFWLEQIARSRNLFEKSGNPNLRGAATTLLQDFQAGKLGKYSLETPL